MTWRRIRAHWRHLRDHYVDHADCEWCRREWFWRYKEVS